MVLITTVGSNFNQTNDELNCAAVQILAKNLEGPNALLASFKNDFDALLSQPVSHAWHMAQHGCTLDDSQHARWQPVAQRLWLRLMTEASSPFVTHMTAYCTKTVARGGFR